MSVALHPCTRYYYDKLRASFTRTFVVLLYEKKSLSGKPYYIISRVLDIMYAWMEYFPENYYYGVYLLYIYIYKHV